VALIGLEGDQRKKMWGRNRDFRGFVNSFFHFLDLVSFTFTKLGKNSRLFFLITCCFVVVISLI